MIRKEKKIILLISTIVFVLSLIVSFSMRIPPEVDAGAYDRIAVNIINGNGYIEDVSKTIQNDFSIARVGPGYEFFLAGLYKFFGHRYGVVWFMQALMHALTAFLVFEISKRLFRDNWKPLIGNGAALLIGLSPDLILASSMLLTETLGVFLMTATVYLFFRYFEDEKYVSMIAMAVFFAFSVLVRSQLVIFLPIFIIFFVLQKKWLKIIVFLIIFFAIFTPWVVRNYKQYDEIIPFNAALGYNLWNGNHLEASGEMEPNYLPMINYAKDHTPLEVNKEGIFRFKQFVSQYPFEFGKLILKKTSIFFSFSRPVGFWPSLTPLQQFFTASFSLVHSVVIFVLGFAGIFMFIKKWKSFSADGKKKIIFAISMAIFIPLSVIPILVESRYRYPIYPFMALFGGYLLSEINSMSFLRKLKYIALPLSFLMLNSVFDFILNFNKFLERLNGIV